MCHICFSILCLLHNMSSLSVKWLVHYDGQIIKTNEDDTFQSPNPLFFETKRGLTLEAFENKNPPTPLSSTIGPSMQYFILIPTSSEPWNVERYDFSYSSNWDSSILWIVCKHRPQYSSHPKPWTNTFSTIILSSVPLFTIKRCNPRHFFFNPTRTNYI